MFDDLFAGGRACCWVGVLGLSFAVPTAATPLRGAASACIPAVSYLPLDGAQVGRDSQDLPVLGTYERISPDGRFVLRSGSGAKLGQVSLVELPPLPGDALQVHRTPLSNEAFPVQGSWRYLVDVDGRHFKFTDILRMQAQAKPVFAGGMSGFYAAASELDPLMSPDPGLIWIRSMSWPQGGRESQGTGPLQVRTLGVEVRGHSPEVVHDTGAQFICNQKSVTDGNVYTLPMLSVDGLEFSAMPINPSAGKPSMRVYGLSPTAMAAEHPCDLRVDLISTPGKAVFGFKQEGSPSMLTYMSNRSVFFIDRRPEGAGQEFQIEDLKQRVLASAFPGITRDGRIIFGATWQRCEAERVCVEQAGYVVADPLQNKDYRQHMASKGVNSLKACITVSDVRRERKAFAERHGLQP